MCIIQVFRMFQNPTQQEEIPSLNYYFAYRNPSSNFKRILMKRHWKHFGCFVGFASYLDGTISFRKESRHFPYKIRTLSAIADARLTLLKNVIFIKPESRSGCFPFWDAPSLLPRNYVPIAAVDDALVHVFFL